MTDRAWVHIRPEADRVVVEIVEAGVTVSRLRLTGSKAVQAAALLLSAAHRAGHQLPFASEAEAPVEPVVLQ
jgi:hypothetical protein